MIYRKDKIKGTITCLLKSSAGKHCTNEVLYKPVYPIYETMYYTNGLHNLISCHSIRSSLKRFAAENDYRTLQKLDLPKLGGDRVLSIFGVLCCRFPYNCTCG
ncbi:hypothetical protein CEXT_427251 [Caerostris extrusa]|uniref:Uncharacterized protein n=1 Tax=Caerostris extrusa TaxID=172846 RepID=A0AAV4W545_CAEEX|nr:hypothetical protein CEXT_427251 [Caerostris extrusa]